MGRLATGLAIFSAACLATLIVVVAVKNIDTLSTVALAPRPVCVDSAPVWR
jgi:hypothetical protein